MLAFLLRLFSLLFLLSFLALFFFPLTCFNGILFTLPISVLNAFTFSLGHQRLLLLLSVLVDSLLQQLFGDIERHLEAMVEVLLRLHSIHHPLQQVVSLLPDLQEVVHDRLFLRHIFGWIFCKSVLKLLDLFIRHG